ncbi:MAG: hypothetical protein WBA23_06380 [Tunicatimonas sp.]|uniref:hypothetical protein n=1 Tax=Tunicatimonas sp. TaxID=1940096 RepID=UPI003C77C5E3
MKILAAGMLTLLSYAASAQLIIDKKATAKSGENLAVNLLKGQQYRKIRDFTQDVDNSYQGMKTSQQQVLDDLKQAGSVRDLHWADLSKSIYLATELVKGPIQPGLEIDFVIDHPIFNRYPDDTYRDLFIAGRADALPKDVSSLQRAQQASQVLSESVHQIVAERKAYAAVAFQYVSEDLLLKATEMNEVLKQSHRFSMTEAERIRLQTFAENYLLLVGQLLERSDALLLDVATVKPLQRQADQEQKRLERTTIARTLVLNY